MARPAAPQRAPERLVVATHNPEKLAEIRACLRDLPVALVPASDLALPPAVEDGRTLAENARKKAVAAARATGLPAIADDTGLEVKGLGGAPGVHAARYAGERATYRENVAKLLREMESLSGDARSARFVTVICMALPNGGIPIEVEGAVEGVIVRVPRGEGGFGYDPVFEVASGRTLAELGADEKNTISHRGRALRAFAEALARRTGTR